MLSDDNEDYTKLKAIVKESVKAVLSENKQVISVSFAALIQTLKDDPEMVKLIQNITSANDGEQHKDNHIDITQYFESNKDRILILSEKNYENLVEALTNIAINTAADSSYNSTLSLPQSSLSTFPNLSTQSDIYRKEESEFYDSSRDDIDE